MGRQVKHFTPTTDALQLLIEGQLALSQVEATGVRVDKAYLEKALDDTAAQVKVHEQAMRDHPDYRLWRKRFGSAAAFTNNTQLSAVIFGDLGFRRKVKFNADAKDSDEEGEFEGINHPLKVHFFAASKMRKARTTYLLDIQRNMVCHGPNEWRVHPHFHLNTVATFRSSCVAKDTLIEVVRDVSLYPKGVPIQDVKVGDYAYCYDADRRLTLRRVTWAGKTGHRKVIRIHWTAKGKHGFLDLTPEHRVRMASGRYVPAVELNKGTDFRTSDMSRHSARVATLALGRVGSRLFETGNPVEILDHRFVYEQLVGPLTAAEVIHHCDDNHLNNHLVNLQKMTNQAEHARHHAPTVLTDAGRRKGCAARVRNHLLFGDRFLKGSDHGRWIELSRWQVLRVLAAHGGSPTEVRNRGVMDFDTFKSKMRSAGVDQAAVRRRYDGRGRYITRGRMIVAAGEGVGPAAKHLGVSYYNAKTLYEERGLDPGTGPGRGRRSVNNHRITDIEELEHTVDVYDLQVEEHENFIANEICVHNCSNPNWQNNPNRNPLIAEIIRKSYIASQGFYLGECDQAQIETRTPCFYSFDPNLMEYCEDPTKDMHRDMAMQLFKMTAVQGKDKAVRHIAKNQMVFPTLYGGYFKQNAPLMWESLVLGQVKVAGTDTLVTDHLAQHGITELGDCDPKERARPGTFEAHVADIEADFWGRRFKVLAQWKRDWLAAYQKDGGCQFLTGFIMTGPHAKNDITNYCVQGVSFHLCLWALIKINRLLRRHKFRTRIIGEIHDCINFEGPASERDDVIDLFVQVMERDVRVHWPWINVRIPVEPEACPVDGNWYSKMPLIRTPGADTWGPAKPDEWAKKYGEWV